MFVELHARSAFTFLEAAALPEDLAEEAARLDQRAIALVDRDGVYGAPRLYKACTKLGLAPLVGAEITLADGGQLPLLVEDREGYKNLCRLVTRMKMRAPKGEAAATFDDLAEHAAGLHCLTGGDEGPLAARLAARRRGRRARRCSTGWSGSSAASRLRRAPAPPAARGGAPQPGAASTSRGRLRLPLVATNGVRYARPGRHAAPRRAHLHPPPHHPRRGRAGSSPPTASAT